MDKQTLMLIVRLIGMLLIQIGLWEKIGWKSGLVSTGLYWLTMNY